MKRQGNQPRAFRPRTSNLTINWYGVALPANILSPDVLKQTEFAATTSSRWSYARYVALRLPVKASHRCSGWSRLVLTNTLVAGSAEDMCGYLYAACVRIMCHDRWNFTRNTEVCLL